MKGKIKNISIVWTKTQDEFFGLDHTTKAGVFANYDFDIRYDSDDEPRKKPKCGVSLTIWGAYPEQGKRWTKKVMLQCQLCKDVDQAVKFAEDWLKKEAEKFIEFQS